MGSIPGTCTGVVLKHRNPTTWLYRNMSLPGQYSKRCTAAAAMTWVHGLCVQGLVWCRGFVALTACDFSGFVHFVLVGGACGFAVLHSRFGA